jgi:hypothetical protein
VRIDLIRVKSLVTSFRSAIERWVPHCSVSEWKEFPTGCCGDTAWLLGTFLKDQGSGTFNRVLGERGPCGDSSTHAWIEGGAVIVDITADQFEEMKQNPVIVTLESKWHEQFRRKEEFEADYRKYEDAGYVRTLDSIYEAILRESRVA